MCERESVCVCVCVCVCVRECVCVCERESVCVRECVSECVCVCVCECVKGSGQWVSFIKRFVKFECVHFLEVEFNKSLF